MKTFQIIAVKDELTNTFLQPTFIETIEEAKRIFKYQINNIDLWKYNSSDYSLYKLGEYNAETGTINNMLEKIISGHSVKDKEDK